MSATAEPPTVMSATEPATVVSAAVMMMSAGLVMVVMMRQIRTHILPVDPSVPGPRTTRLTAVDNPPDDHHRDRSEQYQQGNQVGHRERAHIPSM